MSDIAELISILEAQSAELLSNERALTSTESQRVKAIHQAMPLLSEAASFFASPAEFDNLITYKIVSDLNGKLKEGARTACNFWNRFVVPRSSIVIRLGVFSSKGRTIARAYKPYVKDGVMYGIVEFNTKYLNDFNSIDIAGTVVHEIGHTLGFGWDDWMPLFHRSSGEFTEKAISQLEALEDMLAETDYGSGTRYSHWDEETHDRELMTGFKDKGEYVLPVTIDVMELLGHRVIERLYGRVELGSILQLV